MPCDSNRNERLTAGQIAPLRMQPPAEKMSKVFEINRRVKAAMYEVVRRDVPYFTDEQVHDAVCAMLLTKAMPECIDVRAVEREVLYGEPAGNVCRATT